MCFDVRCFCCQASTPTQYFWYRTTLMVSEDIDHPTQFNWKIGFALIIAWILVYMCMIKGIASSGKVMSAISAAVWHWLIQRSLFFYLSSKENHSKSNANIEEANVI